MTHRTTMELVRCYLTNHGAACDEARSDSCWLNFICRGHKFELVSWGGLGAGIDIRLATTARWFDVNLLHGDIDERDPEFDPEKFFEPLLTRIEEELS